MDVGRHTHTHTDGSVVLSSGYIFKSFFRCGWWFLLFDVAEGEITAQAFWSAVTSTSLSCFYRPLRMSLKTHPSHSKQAKVMFHQNTNLLKTGILVSPTGTCSLFLDVFEQTGILAGSLLLLHFNNLHSSSSLLSAVFLFCNSAAIVCQMT